MRQITDNQLYVHHLYESDVFPYGEHSVSIRSKKPDNQLYEIYKLVFWPSLKARRLNSTVFDKTDAWNTESDGIGGIRQYSVKENSVKTGSFTKTFLLQRSGYIVQHSLGVMEEWKFQMIDMIMLVESAEMLYKEITEKTLNFVLTNCVFDSCKCIEDCKAICYFVEFTRQANIEIRELS